MTTPEAWASSQMALRYGATVLDTDHEFDFPRICYTSLCQEYGSIRGWFSSDGKLNPMLYSASLINRVSWPIGNGVRFDWSHTGEPLQTMCMFKGTMIAAYRAAAFIPERERNSGSSQFGGIATLIR